MGSVLFALFVAFLAYLVWPKFQGELVNFMNKEESIKVLKKRYAKGRITRREYHEKLRNMI